MPVSPALFPKIMTEKGETLSDVSTVEAEAASERGMARYVVSDRKPQEFTAVPGLKKHPVLVRLFSTPPAWAQEKQERKRQTKYIVKDVTQVQGLAKTNLVISDADAKELKDEDSSSQILKRCRVIVVVSSALGGIEGKLFEQLALSR